MYNDKVKKVLNKIDYNLKEIFENVIITQLDNRKEPTFEIKLYGFKANKNNNAEVVIEMTESTMYDSSVIWKYKTNPLNENTMFVTRTSTLNSIAMDIEDVILGNRFDKEYIKHISVVNESESPNVDKLENDISDLEENSNSKFEFEFDESVIVEGVEASIIDREKFVVENIEYNIYKVYVDGCEKSVFGYDIHKK